MYNHRFKPSRQQSNRFQQRRPSFGQFRNNNRPNRTNRSEKSVAEVVAAIRANMNKKPEVVQEVALPIIHTHFSEFAVADSLKRNIVAKNYTAPTPIQDHTITHILEGKDVIGIANTGTGKTAAFLIPLINKVISNRNEKVLIIAPTRELALQINDEFFSFVKGLGIYSAVCIGGTSMYMQRNALRRPYQFLIGTPGRIKDLVNSKAINLSLFHNVVLDEADRMVDIGFIHDIKMLISLMPKERQSLFFSATVGPQEKEIMNQFLKNPVTVSVKKQETAASVHQELVKVISKDQKIEQLHDLLNKKEFAKTLIFGRTKWGVQKLANQLVERGFKAGAIHGNKSQYQRQHVLDQFKKGQISILLATDVASRGIDIENVSHVINYDVPATYEDYVHRIGRTGRANNEGIAITFVD